MSLRNQMQREPLLQEVLEQGWSEQRRKAFLERYGPLLQRSLLYQMRCHFGPGGLRAVRAYLNALQGKQNGDSGLQEGAQAELIDLAVNVWQDVLAEVFRSDPESGLIDKYVRYHQTSDSTETEGSFEGFLRQSVRYKFLNNLPHKLSQKEIFDKIVDLERETDRDRYIQEAHDRYAEAVRDQLRWTFPALDRGYEENVVRYFFERFLPDRYPQLRQERTASQLQGRTLQLLLNAFGQSDCEEGMRYHGQSRPQRGKIESRSDAALERVGTAEEITLANETDVYWDQLLRCAKPSPDSITQELRVAEPDKATALCWACAKLKRESPRKDTRENLIAFIAFYCSQRGPSRPTEEWPSPDELSLERIEGRYLRWEEDVCQAIFGKTIRKDRVLDMVVRTLVDSPYQHLLPDGAQKGGEAS